MAESAVTFLLNKLALILQEEENLLRGFRGEMVWIKDELERMRAFLRGADSMEDGDDEEVKVWVKQVRYAAYDTEDVLDEFNLRFQHHPKGKGCLPACHKASSSVKNLKARHEIASDIQSIKSRIKDISEGFRRYRLKLEVAGNATSSSSVAGNKDWLDRRGDALLIEEAELVGIAEPKRQLVEWLLEGDSRMNVVSVVGMGGLGKTTLIKKAYDDVQVKDHFKSHAWINVSQSFKLEELLKDIIRQLFIEMNQSVPQTLDSMNRDQLKATIKEFLKGRRYLIALDDVWNINDWEGFRYALPDNNSGSREQVSFPAEAEAEEEEISMVLPSSLIDLTICNFPNLESLSSKGFQNLTSLEDLTIEDCHKLQYFPENGLPPSLLRLYINDCTLLEQRCQRDQGQEWSNISHVPDIAIDMRSI